METQERHRFSAYLSRDVWEALQRRARANRRSCTAECEVILRDSLTEPIDRIRHTIEASREL